MSQQQHTALERRIVSFLNRIKDPSVNTKWTKDTETTHYVIEGAPRKYTNKSGLFRGSHLLNLPAEIKPMLETNDHTRVCYYFFRKDALEEFFRSDLGRSLLMQAQQQRDRPEWIVPLLDELERLNKNRPLRVNLLTMPPQARSVYLMAMVAPSKTTSVEQAARLIKDLKPSNKWLQNYDGDIVVWSSRMKKMYSALTLKPVNTPHQAQRLLQNAQRQQATQQK